MTAVELTIKGDVSVLRLGPTDKLLIQLDNRDVSRELADAVRENAAAAFGLDVERVVVVGSGARLEVMSA